MDKVELSEVERVARAICIAFGDDPDREGDRRVTAYDNAARAAIAALTLPSKAIEAAFSEGYRAGGNDADGKHSAALEANAWHNSEARAALSTTPQEK